MRECVVIVIVIVMMKEGHSQVITSQNQLPVFYGSSVCSWAANAPTIVYNQFVSSEETNVTFNTAAQSWSFSTFETCDPSSDVIKCQGNSYHIQAVRDIEATTSKLQECITRGCILAKQHSFSRRAFQPHVWAML